MDSELNFKLQELQELVQNIEKMENDLELLDHMLPGIDPTDQDELKKFEKEEQELLQKYQDAKMRLLTLKQELRRVELSKTRDMSKLISTKIPLLGPLSKLPIKSSLENETSSNFGGNDEVTAWEIKDEEIKIDYKAPLGNGAFATVYKGTCRGKDVAVKIIKGNIDDNILVDFKNEVAILSKLRHENLLLFMGVSIQSKQLKIITELMTKGSVYSLLRKEKLSMKRKMLLARDCALGMNWLHKQGILHLDLKPANILVNDNWIAKVADFGLSQFKGKVPSFGGTPNYMAPELFTGGTPDDKTDVYAFGMILWELVAEKYPWEDQLRSLEEFIRVVGREGKRPEIPKQCPRRLRELIQKCWAQDPTLRPSFEQIAESNVFYRIIVEDLIQDNEGRLFWEKYFLTEHEVPYSRFLVNFCSFLNVHLPRDYSTNQKFVSLRLAFANDKNIVTIEHFANVLGWYGPMGKNSSIIDRIFSIVALDGFFGEMTREEAEQTLVKQRESSFLVRLSSNTNDFVISAKTKSNEYTHYRIQRKGNGFTFNNRDFESLPKVIEYFAKSKKFHCRHIVTGSKLQSALQILQVDESQFKGYTGDPNYN